MYESEDYFKTQPYSLQIFFFLIKTPHGNTKGSEHTELFHKINQSICSMTGSVAQRPSLDA